MTRPRPAAVDGAPDPPARPRRPKAEGERRREQETAPPLQPSPLAHAWVEVGAGLPLPAPLELPSSAVLTPADVGGDGVHRIRGHGQEALRRRLVDDFLAMGFEVAQARHDHEGGPVAGPWVLELRPPLDLVEAAAALTVRGEVRILSRAVGAFPVVARGDLSVEPYVHWRARLATNGSARVGEGCRLEGPLTCRGELDLGAGSLVTGRMRCSVLRLGAGARLAGGIAMRPQGGPGPALLAVHRRIGPQPSPLAEPVPSLEQAAVPLPEPAAPAATMPMTASAPTSPAEELLAAMPLHPAPAEMPEPAIAPIAPVAPIAPMASAAPLAPMTPLAASPPPASPPATATPPLHERPPLGEQGVAAEPEHQATRRRPSRLRADAGPRHDEFTARADLELDGPQTWRLLSGAAWLDLFSAEALREQELEFEGRPQGRHVRFAVLRDRRLREAKVPKSQATPADPLLGLLAQASQPVRVRGHVRGGRLHLTVRATDRGSLDEALAAVGQATAVESPGEAGLAPEAGQ